MVCVWYERRIGFPVAHRSGPIFLVAFTKSTESKLTTWAGILLIVVPIAFNVTFFLLQRAFEYPDILRKPTDYILQRFKEGGAPLRRLWYAFTFSALLFTPVPVLVGLLFQQDAPWYLVVGTILGVL